jgi:putative membrane protein
MLISGLLDARSWSAPIPVTLALIFSALVYSRGWFHLRRTYPSAISVWRSGAFMSGLLLIWIALGSPLGAFDDDLLTVHMLQHILLMAVAPPLILLGAPALPLLHGLPRRFVRTTLADFLRWPLLQEAGRTVTHPVFGWLSATLALVIWHIPTLFELGLRSDNIHEVEHACFFLTGLLFWWPIIQPWPSVARFPRWCIPLYLFLATLPCDALSAFLTFCDRVVYPSYLSASPPFKISPLVDQETAGAIMWVCVTFIYLVPAVIVTVQILSTPTAPVADPNHPVSHGTRTPEYPTRLEVV